MKFDFKQKILAQNNAYKLTQVNGKVYKVKQLFKSIINAYHHRHLHRGHLDPQ
jgi:hypothetical protein